MTKSIFIVGFATVAALASGQEFLTGRELQSQRRAPLFYDDNALITFKSQLGCGACIRGGYIYCIPGAEGSDPSTWGGKAAVCCRNSNTCPQLSDASYICSNTYTDTTLAKAMCPFNSGCGSKNSISFTGTQQADSLNITVKAGDTCTYLVEVTCGLPAFHPNTTEGFEIETFDADEGDFEPVAGRILGAANISAIARMKNLTQMAKNRNITRVNKNPGQVPQNKSRGPQVSKYNPTMDGALKKFKEGLTRGANETLCSRKRFQQISITALGNLTSQAARVLQSGSGTDDSSYSMAMTLQTTDFQASGSGSVFLYVQLGLISVVAIFTTMLF